MLFIQMDLNLFCEMIYKDKINEKKDDKHVKIGLIMLIQPKK
jgi:hypothetical protein